MLENGRKRVLVYGMTDNPGGIETYLMNLIKEMPIIKFDFVTDFPKMAYEKELKEYGAEIYYIPAKSRGLLAQWKDFWKILKQHPEYHVIYFNILNAGAMFTMVVPWILRRKIVIHSHNGSADNIRFHNVCRPFMNFMGSQFVSCSKLAGQFMFGKQIMKKKDVLIIPNAIDVDKYEYSLKIRETMRKQLEIENKFVICHVGRIVQQKNPKGVIDIVAECVKKDKSCVLLSVGTGDMEEEIKHYVEDMKLEEHVQFLGVRNDVNSIMQAADCFILPSIYEGLPIVAIEAQAADLPCILSDTISKETKLTSLVEFLPLNEWEKWSATILNTKNRVRQSRKKEIQVSGYDLRHQEENMKQLLKVLK